MEIITGRKLTRFAALMCLAIKAVNLDNKLMFDHFNYSLMRLMKRSVFVA